MPSQEYLHFLESLKAEYQPATAMQEFAVEQAAQCARELQHMNVEFNKCQTDFFDQRPDMSTWTASQFAAYDRLLRYRIQAERSFERAWKGVERIRSIHLKAQYREFWEKLQNRRLDMKEKPKEEPRPAPKYKPTVINLIQIIQVILKDGVISYTAHPRLSDMHIRATFLTPEARVFRRFEFPNGIPAEYAWADGPDMGQERFTRIQIFDTVDQWRAHSAIEEAAGPNCYLPKGQTL